jgi:transposase
LVQGSAILSAKKLACSDHAEEFRWQHLEARQFKAVLKGLVPRVDCPEPGNKSMAVPWALRESRFATMFKVFAIEVLLMTQTVKGVLAISRRHVEDTTWRIIERTFEAIEEGHDTEAAKSCFSQLSREQLKSVEVVAMDMSQAFVRAAKEMIPFAESKIVHDKFHYMKMADDAVEKVRRGEHKRLLKDGDDRHKGSKYFWLTSLEHHSEKQHAKFQSICNLSLATERAWSYKDRLCDIWVQKHWSLDIKAR